jgi:hypothetical protein
MIIITTPAIKIEIVAAGASAWQRRPQAALVAFKLTSRNRIIHKKLPRVTRNLKGVVDLRIAHGQAIALGARYRIIPVTIKNVFGWIYLVSRTRKAIGAVGHVVVLFAAGFSGGRPV